MARVPAALWVVLGWTALLIFASAVAKRGDVNSSNLGQIQLGASLAHPFGTDDIGRDIFARTVASAQFTLMTASLATAIGVVGGVLFGSIAVAARGRASGLLSAMIAATIAVPPLLFAIMAAAVIGVGATGAVVGVGIAQVPSIARLTQTLTASIVSRDHVRAASLLGIGQLKVFSRHVLPHVAGPLAIHVTLVFGLSLVAISTLSFLGVGLQTPDYDWGLLVSDGQRFIATNALAAVGPGLFIVVTGVLFAGVGESIGLEHHRSSNRQVTHDGEGPDTEIDADTGGIDPAAAATVCQLSIGFARPAGTLVPVRLIDVTVPATGRVGLVGESGSGKSLTARAIAGLLPSTASILSGTVTASGLDMTEVECLDRRELARATSMVFQDPNMALNPALRIGRQLTEGVRTHENLDRKQSNELAIETLRAVQINDPESVMNRHPHELSGGMRQRVCIAIALMSRPALVIADEPTTALDNIVQKEVLFVLDEALRSTNTALLLISHDLAVVAQLCDEIYVMCDGVIVEHGPRDQVLHRPDHEYTQALLNAQPQMGGRRRREELPL